MGRYNNYSNSGTYLDIILYMKEYSVKIK